MDGHHAFWLILLIEAHVRAGWTVEVLTARDTSPLEAQARLRGVDLSGVRLHREDEKDGTAVLKRARNLASERGAGRIFVAFLDRLWPAILAEDTDRLPGVKLSGIWFHPHALDNCWRWAPPLGKRWKLRGRLHRFLASEAAARVFDSVYFPVEESVARWCRLVPEVRAHLLPDPYEREPRLSRDEARRRLGLPADRVVFLHLGSPERRKGLPDVLAAFSRLRSRSFAAGSRLPLLLRAGPNDRLRSGERRLLEDLVREGWASAGGHFVPAEELMEYFAACDWVLIPYRKFRYSSGILANAIGADRQVIAYDYGEVGRFIKTTGGGVVCRHGSRDALYEALCTACTPGVAISSGARKEGRSPAAFIAALGGALAGQ